MTGEAPSGAVLTGGGSRRMGAIKALVEVDGRPMARRVADALLAAGCSGVTLIGGDPVELAVLGLAVVPDRHPGSGPLDGVITAIEASVGDVVIAACDLAYLTGTAVGALVDAADADPAADVIVARTARVEPACALWRQTALRTAQAAFGDGERAVHRVLDQLRTIEVRVADDELRNINAPGDLPG